MALKGIGRPKDHEKRELAFKAYRLYKNGRRVAEELDIDPATISRWKNEEDWDGQLEDLDHQLDEVLKLSEIGDRQYASAGDLELDFDAENAHFDRAKELAIQALQAIKSGEVKFRSMSEAMRAVESFRELDRLQRGEPTEISTTQHSFSLTGLSPDDPAIQIAGLLKIMTGVDPSAVKAIAEAKMREVEEEVIEVEPEDG